jgi:hypothetical protein
MITMAAVSFLLGAQLSCADLYSRIREDYFDSTTGLYREYWGRKNDNQQTAFNWGVGVMLSAQNALARLDRTYQKDLVEFLEAGEKYWNPNGPVAGFDVLPGPPFPNDRYYDDNAWMAMALVESYEITGNRKWLDRATETLRFVLSGYDSKLGGGIYWREKDKPSKNTCSSAPAAAACLAIYDHTRNKELLLRAENLYEWTKKTFQDPSDYLYWDNIDLKEKLDKTKWSYNSALMLRTAKHLSRVTRKVHYKEDADRIEASSRLRWLKPNGVVNDELQFGHLLVENLYAHQIDMATISRSLFESMLDGRIGGRWGQIPKADDRLQLIHQASALRLLCIFELWKRRASS